MPLKIIWIIYIKKVRFNYRHQCRRCCRLWIGKVVQVTPPKPPNQSGFKRTSGTVKMLFCAIRQKRCRLYWCLMRALLHKSAHPSMPLCVHFKIATGLKLKMFIQSQGLFFLSRIRIFVSPRTGTTP